jgi:starch phosphorylase
MLHANQARIHSFRVVPDVPEPLRPLLEVAQNLWWTWHPEAARLFKRVDADLWEKYRHNPIRLLGHADQKLLDRLATDQSYLRGLQLVQAGFENHQDRVSWCQRQHADHVAPTDGSRPMRVAYFSAEFGLTECLQIYSGGLGCLAGDHLKSASELGVPLCAVGLLYRCGYFHQYLNSDGWQQERYPEIDYSQQPVHRVPDGRGDQLRITAPLPGRDVHLAIWRVDVGRVPLYLLDANLPENSPEDRDITRTLYGGDIEMRIKQEIVLGIGGVRALEAVGERPTVYHINEGHAAFLALERIAGFREREGADFDSALRAAASGQVFTTHTPVPAGIDRFDPALVERYLSMHFDRLGIDRDRFMGLGRSNPYDDGEPFSMAVLALRTSQQANGVSRLHGEVAREMWQGIWPGVPPQETPIAHVTNGVHPRSWVSSNLVSLFDRYLSPDWQLDPRESDELWERVHDIPDEELWSHRTKQREKLVTWCRRRLRKQLRSRGAGYDEIERACSALDPNILTIGIARRFATYKRGNLLMRDLERLETLLSNEKRPLQIIIAGKAHPADGPGKEIIRHIAKLSQSATDHLNRIVFIENYDMEVGRRLTQGCDIWLNTPVRGMEASGTSGMKAAMNGVITCSILDGWWDEAYEPDLGFAIGRGEDHENPDERDSIEGRALLDVVERQILPEFYERDVSSIPRKWVKRMKRCIATLTPRFSTQRMVADYVEQHYLRAHTLSERLLADNLAEARSLSAQIHRFREFWPHVRVNAAVSSASQRISIRENVDVNAEVRLGELTPDEVRVEIYAGRVTSLGNLVDAAPIEMVHEAALDEAAGVHRFRGAFRPDESGRRGFTIRVLPRDPRLEGSMIPGLITWDDGPGRPAGSSQPAPERPAAVGA